MSVCCAICQEPWTRPKTLPCEHIFCEECLEAVIRRTGATSLNCPVCRISHSLPSQGLKASWKTSRKLEDLAEGFRSLEVSSPTFKLSPVTADPEKSFIMRPSSLQMSVEQTCIIHVQLCDGDGQQIAAQPGVYDITAYVDLKPSSTGFERQKLEPAFTNQGGIYIHYLAQSCGLHVFSVQLKDRSLIGSPLAISVLPRGILGCEVRGILKGPRDVVAYKGNFLVTDGIAKSVYLVNQNGFAYQRLKVPENMTQEFSPMAIAAFQEKVFVADMGNGCIHVYENLNYWPRQLGKDRLQKPTGVAVSSDTGSIFVVDNGRKLILVYSHDYRYVKSINYQVRYKEDALFNPQMVAINSSGDKLYIADHGNRGRENSIKIINVFDDSLERTIDVKVGKAPARPNGIGFDRNGNIYVSVSYLVFGNQQGETAPRPAGCINMYNSLGEILCMFGRQLESPNGLIVLPPSATPASMVYVADSPGKGQDGSLVGFIV